MRIFVVRPELDLLRGLSKFPTVIRKNEIWRNLELRASWKPGIFQFCNMEFHEKIYCSNFLFTHFIHYLPHRFWPKFIIIYPTNPLLIPSIIFILKSTFQLTFFNLSTLPSCILDCSQKERAKTFSLWNKKNG